MCSRMCVGEANKISYPQERNPLIEDIKRPGEAGELIKDGLDWIDIILAVPNMVTSSSTHNHSEEQTQKTFETSNQVHFSNKQTIQWQRLNKGSIFGRSHVHRV